MEKHRAFQTWGKGLGFCCEEEEKALSSTSGPGALKCDGTSVDVRG